MSDDYVRKDLYDEGIKRIEAMMAASEARHQAQIRELRAICEGLGDTIAAYADMTNKRIDALENAMNRRIDDLPKSGGWTEKILSGALAVTGIAIGLAAVIIAGVQVYLALKGGN